MLLATVTTSAAMFYGRSRKYIILPGTPEAERVRMIAASSRTVSHEGARRPLCTRRAPTREWLGTFLLMLTLVSLLPACARDCWALASNNIPLDSPVYSYLDKLAGLGVIRNDVQGLKPYSKSEAARLIMRIADIRSGGRKEHLGYLLEPLFAAALALYLLVNLLYSKWLKHVPIVDVLIIASGFVLRVAAGVTLIDVERFSPWLYVVMTLLSLFLGFGKRRAELKLLDRTAKRSFPEPEDRALPKHRAMRHPSTIRRH